MAFLKMELVADIRFAREVRVGIAAQAHAKSLAVHNPRIVACNIALDAEALLEADWADITRRLEAAKQATREAAAELRMHVRKADLDFALRSRDRVRELLSKRKKARTAAVVEVAQAWLAGAATPILALAHTRRTSRSPTAEARATDVLRKYEVALAQVKLRVCTAPNQPKSEATLCEKAKRAADEFVARAALKSARVTLERLKLAHGRKAVLAQLRRAPAPELAAPAAPFLVVDAVELKVFKFVNRAAAETCAQPRCFLSARIVWEWEQALRCYVPTCAPVALHAGQAAQPATGHVDCFMVSDRSGRVALTWHSLAGAREWVESWRKRGVVVVWQSFGYLGVCAPVAVYVDGRDTSAWGRECRYEVRRGLSKTGALLGVFDSNANAREFQQSHKAKTSVWLDIGADKVLCEEGCA